MKLLIYIKEYIAPVAYGFRIARSPEKGSARSQFNVGEIFRTKGLKLQWFRISQEPDSCSTDHQFPWFPTYAAETGKDSKMPEIVNITGIGPALATACAEAGFSGVDKIARATPAELATVPGIGETSAKTLIIAAQSLLNGAAEPNTQAIAPAKPKKKKKKGKINTEKSSKSKKKKKKNKSKNGKSKKKSKKKKSKSGKKK